ncbi:MAG: hypothetical protein J6S00_02350 [Clostridia bacterium]|nr:hypothetical protein [Clostridia bacterium]
MVKGVNKTVIEINDTGSAMFDKVVLFVSPQYGNISTKRLNGEAQNLIGKFEADLYKTPGVRQRFKMKRRVRIVLSIIVAAIITAAVIFVIF